MLKHTDQLYRLAELPAFIEEALSNVSLKGIISAYVSVNSGGSVHPIYIEILSAVDVYAEQWVNDWMDRHPEPLSEAGPDHLDPEIRAIEAGVRLFSNPDCRAGLPE